VSQQSSEQSPQTTVTCHTCHERMDVPLRKVSRKIACVDCGRPVHVPSLAEYTAQRPPDIQDMVRDVGEYELTAPTVTDINQVASTPYWDQRAKHHQEKEAPKPKWTFASGVFQFPFLGEAVGRWVSLSILLFLALGVGAIALLVGGNIHKVQASPQGAVLAFFVLPEIWLGLWALSYGAACCLTIIEGTAAGLVRIESWPEPDWRQWAGEFFFLLWLVILTATIAWGLTLPLTLWQPETSRTPWIVVITWVLFPFVVLSSLESLVAWRPWSPRTWRTLVEHPLDWLAYQALALIVAGVWVAFVWFGARVFGSLIQPLSAPLLAAVLFINARLLGRLAYKISRGD
jgi:hypothetical protein